MQFCKVAVVASTTTLTSSALASEKSFQKSAPQRLLPNDSAELLLTKNSRTLSKSSAINGQMVTTSEKDGNAPESPVPVLCFENRVCSTHRCFSDVLPPNTMFRNRETEKDEEMLITSTNSNDGRIGQNVTSLRPLLSTNNYASSSSKDRSFASSFSSSSSFNPSFASSRSHSLFIHSHLPQYTFLPLLLVTLLFSCIVVSHSSASAASIFGQHLAAEGTTGSSSITSSISTLSSTLPSVQATTSSAVQHIKSRHHSALHHNQPPLSPFASGSAHQYSSSSIQERLNPIEMLMLSNLINHKQLHHPEYHYKPSRSAYAEHSFDPSSEEITMESSARTVSASQKRDIHESIEGMYGIHNGRRAQQTNSGVSGSSAEGSSEQQRKQHQQEQKEAHYPHHYPKTDSNHHQHQVEVMNNGEEMSASRIGEGGDSALPMGQNSPSRESDILAREIPKWLFWLHPARTHLTLGEAHALVKSVINNGLVEKLDFKTLEHLTRKYAPGTQSDKDEDFIELHSETSDESSDMTDLSKRGKIDKMTAVKFESEDPLNPEEELLTVKMDSSQNKESLAKSGGGGGDEAFTKNNPGNGRSEAVMTGGAGNVKEKTGGSNPFGSAIVNEDLFKNYQNLEQVMEILMHSENTLKKRGEGPQLSIDSALTVLRERLLLEFARRKAKATEKQIQINTEILKKLGRRRRRRSVADWQFADQFEQQNEKKLSPQQTGNRKTAIDCDKTKCNLYDLNSKWSNVHQSLVNLVGDYHVASVPEYNKNSAVGVSQSWSRLKPYFGGSNSGGQRFRNNDKYISAFDAEDDDAEKRANQLEVESPASPSSEQAQDRLFEGLKDVYQKQQNRLTYSNSSPLTVNSRVRINSRKPALRLPLGPSLSSFRRAKLSHHQWQHEK